MNVLYILVVVILGIILLYMLAIMPRVIGRVSDKPFQGWMFAHRGLFDNKSKAPENSLPAFKNAVDNHYGIELDVQLTKDEVIVVFHDNDIFRMCGVDKNVRDITYEELCKYTLKKSKCKIPTLKEALQVIDGKVPLIVELKLEYNYKRTCELVNAMLTQYKGVYCIESFNPLGLYWYRRYNPRILRGQLSKTFLKCEVDEHKFVHFILQNLLLNFLAKPDFIAFKHQDKEALSFRLCTKLFKAYSFAWTVRSEEERESCKGDFQYIIFDHFYPQ